MSNSSCDITVYACIFAYTVDTVDLQRQLGLSSVAKLQVKVKQVSLQHISKECIFTWLRATKCRYSEFLPCSQTCSTHKNTIKCKPYCMYSVDLQSHVQLNTHKDPSRTHTHTHTHTHAHTSHTHFATHVHRHRYMQFLIVIISHAFCATVSTHPFVINT